jgi:TPR repeat protein
MYTIGAGVPQDYAKAVKWIKLAANQGLALGQYNLGKMYLDGMGVPKDITAAWTWCKLAAEQGMVRAQCSLGRMYEQGGGVPQNFLEAAKWLKLAAGEGNADAQCSYGTMHARGQGLPVDITSAAQWFKMAAEQGHESGIDNLNIALHEFLFPPGTKVKLVGLKAAALNGKHGVVVVRGGASAPALGRIAVVLKDGSGTKSIPYEKLQEI